MIESLTIMANLTTAFSGENHQNGVDVTAESDHQDPEVTSQRESEVLKMRSIDSLQICEYSP
jgi:hypothetical protein